MIANRVSIIITIHKAKDYEVELASTRIVEVLHHPIQCATEDVVIEI